MRLARKFARCEPVDLCFDQTMANVANAFSALLGAGESAATSSKKKNKSKAKQNAAGQSNDVSITATSSAASTHAAPQHASVVDASEATAILERAAREARTITDKSKLWKEWSRQVCRTMRGNS